MHKLTNIALHNWYLIDADDIPVDGNTAIIGQTGAGKSSILDAIQTIISGNNKNIIELNAAAGAHKSRSVKDYILGCVSDVNEGEPKRTHCESTIALSFYDEENNHHISFGLMFRINKDGKEDTKRFIANNYEFKITNFIDQDDDQPKVITHKSIISFLKDNLLEEDFNLYPNSIKFVESFLSLMRPKLTPDPKHFLRSFSNTLQAKEMSNPTDFVKRFVLEPQHLDFLGVRESISIWRNLTSEVEILDKKINSLRSVYNDYKAAYSAKTKTETANYKAKNNEQIRIEKQLTALKEKNTEIDAQLNNLNSLKETTEGNLYEKISAKASTHSNNDKLLELDLKYKKQNLQRLKSILSNYRSPLEKFKSLWINENNKLNNDSDITIETETDILNVVTNKNIQNRLINLISDTFLDMEKTSLILSQINKSNENVNENLLNLRKILNNNNIENFKISECIDIKSSELKKPLFTLLKRHADIILIPKNQSDRLFKILSQLQSISTDFIIYLSNDRDNRLNSELTKNIKVINNIVISYLNEITCEINLSLSFDDFFDHKLSITKSGLYKDNNTLYFAKFNESDKNISITEHPENKFSDVKAAHSNLKAKHNHLLELLKMFDEEFINSLKMHIEYKSEISSLTQEIEFFSNEHKHIDSNEIDFDIKNLKLSLENINNDIISLTQISSSNNEKTLNYQTQIEKIILQKEEIQNLQNTNSNIDVLKKLDISETINNLNTINYIEDEQKNYDVNYLFRKANGKLFQYCSEWGEVLPINITNEDSQQCMWTINQLHFYENNELLKYKERLQKAQIEMEISLTEGLINKLGEYFDSIKDQINSLNNKLSKFTFVGQRYQFKSMPNIRFAPILELVEEFRFNRTAKLSDTSEISKKAKKGIKEIEKILLDETQDTRDFEDYREYYNYELYIESSDDDTIKSLPFSSIMGKLSGGQRQAPYYVALAASMVSTYYPKSEPGENQGMGLLVFDEAFNKLDIPNTQKLIALFESLGLQVIVAAPEEKRSSLIECVDSIISINRKPGTSDLFVDYTSIGKYTREQMLLNNPIHKRI